MGKNEKHQDTYFQSQSPRGALDGATGCRGGRRRSRRDWDRARARRAMLTLESRAGSDLVGSHPAQLWLQAGSALTQPS